MASASASGSASASALASAPSPSPSPSVRSWRTTFLTLRDETLTSPSHSTVINLLLHLVFSQSESLIAAAPGLPPHEVTSDVMFLMELSRTTFDSSGGDDDITSAFMQLSRFIYNVSSCVSFEVNSSFWALVLDSFGRMVKTVIGKSGTKRAFVGNVAVIRAVRQCLETIRCLFSVYQTTCSLPENMQLLNFLLSLVECSEAKLIYSSYSSGNWRGAVDYGTQIPGYNNVREVQTITFTMISEVFSGAGSSLPVDVWKSAIEVLRKVMDILVASKGPLAEDNVMSRFYTSLLHCLHLVLINPKGSLSDHVAGFVAALRMFFNYGLTNKSQLAFPGSGYKKEYSSMSLNLNLAQSNKLDSGPYRPPHMRKKDGKNMQLKDRETLSFLHHDTSVVDHMSSDSDYSDGDGSVKDTYSVCSRKARAAAILCVQDLCRADPKLFTAQWTMLLPSSDVLQPRKYEATLMTCLLFDPYLKARIASASTLLAMLDGPASIFLQVAEYRESTRCGSFTALSSSLGQILMQLHTGILYLIQNERHSGLLASLFKILILLISSTPFSRMPMDLLPTVVSSLRAKIGEGFQFRSDQTGLLAIAVNCLTAALSVSPSSPLVKDMFVAELSTGFIEGQEKSGVLSTVMQYCEPVTSPTICFEALQALKAVAHNYPDIMFRCWEQVSSIVYGLLSFTSPEVPSRPSKVIAGNTVGAIGEKVITVAIKVLDECLRAISGFKGTEDLLDDKSFDRPFASDYIKTKTISSAPSYGSNIITVIKDEHETCMSGSEQWSEAIEKHLALILGHPSAMVRAAALTCFAGLTSSVFFSLQEEKRVFVLNSSINGALNDEVPSVRSAACRAIGVIACFPQIYQSAEILDNFIHAAETNTQYSLVSVRITASWALANICDSLRHCINDFTFRICTDSEENSQLISKLIDCTLRLTKDNDKIKANAVRALGNLSRFVQFTSHSGVHAKPLDGTGLSLLGNDAEKLSGSHDHRDNHIKHLASNSLRPAFLEDSCGLERIVQAFLSCVTTGNVKVQWNVCHALSNLFLNETLQLQDMDWASSVFSVLLLLLRDSSNFKIRIQAAAALAVPETIIDYGRSFSDVLQGVEHILENLSSDQNSAPSSFKYRIALEKQLTSTMLHVLGLASRTDHQPIQDFLVKKASFLEEWLKLLCSSLGETSSQLDAEIFSTGNQKKEVISKAIQSLTEVYEARNHDIIARRFEKLAASIQ